jgi:uroporphyrinogen III methyltransferase/synthase
LSGFVSIVGAGPWDPELLTLAGKERLSRADVVIVDYLVNPVLLTHCRPDVTVYQRTVGPHAGPRLDQAEINRRLVEEAKAGRYVVRLKGGDPMVFGRGAEEAQHLRQNDIAFEFVPGVSAAIAAPQTAGIPITHRDHTPAFCVVSGFEAYEKAGLAVQWEHLAKSAGTLVLLMSVKNCGRNAEKLVAAGRDPKTPTAVVRWGTRGIQRTVVGTLENIAERITEAEIRPPAAMIVGEVVDRRDEIKWFESRPLFGRRIVVTRARHQSNELVHALASRGADAVAFPCLDFVEPDDARPLAKAIAALDQYDGVILSSTNGVDAFVRVLLDSGKDVRALKDKLVAAIGTGTAGKCRAAGLVPDIVPAKARSEGLRDELGTRGLLTGRWLHVRADTGRAVLEEAFKAAGGALQVVSGYRTIRPSVPPLLVRSLLPPADGGEGFDAVCFASGTAARHFLDSLGEVRGEESARAMLSGAKVIALGPVTKAAIEALDLPVHVVAKAPTDAAMVEAAISAFGA